eukprot:6201646-Pleurochrysis_carterae.AAC.2
MSNVHALWLVRSTQAETREKVRTMSSMREKRPFEDSSKAFWSTRGEQERCVGDAGKRTSSRSRAKAK